MQKHSPSGNGTRSREWVWRWNRVAAPANEAAFYTVLYFVSFAASFCFIIYHVDIKIDLVLSESRCFEFVSWCDGFVIVSCSYFDNSVIK